MFFLPKIRSLVNAVHKTSSNSLPSDVHGISGDAEENYIPIFATHYHNNLKGFSLQEIRGQIKLPFLKYLNKLNVLHQ